MTLLVSGSIAFDTIMHTVNNFREEDHKDSTDPLYLSLYAHDFRKMDGGAGANIAYSLALLGKSPYLIGTYGDDGREYIERLSEYGIDTSLCQHIRNTYCAHACIIRDTTNGQINTFHMGALAHAGEYSHRPIQVTHAIVAPDAKDAMIRRVRELTEDGVFTIFDPGQALGIFAREELIECVQIADLTIMNEAEQKQFRDITGEDFFGVVKGSSQRAILTLGEHGSTLLEGETETPIRVVDTKIVIDETGCGDSYRAGLLYGLSEGWSLEHSAQLGSVIASIKITHFGGQNHTLDKETLNKLGETYFGETFFA